MLTYLCNKAVQMCSIDAYNENHALAKLAKQKMTNNS